MQTPLVPCCPLCGSETPKVVHNGERFKCKACDKTFLKEKLTYKEVVYQRAQGNKFVITSAVSDSKADVNFLAALDNYCKHNHAQLLIVPVPYRNPTSNTEHPNRVYDVILSKYFIQKPVELGHKLMLFSNVHIQPTASRPLSSMQSFGGEKSAIFGHPKVAAEFVATRLGKEPKTVLTTGAVTKSRYGDSKAGIKGDFHHVIGALVVEIDEEAFHWRHVYANKDGSFFDVDLKYFADGTVSKILEVATTKKDAEIILTCGDLHAVRADPVALEQTFFAKDSIFHSVRPSVVMIHDGLDFQSASHHNGFFTNMRLHNKGERSVQKELEATCALIDRIAELDPNVQIVIVDSNHPRHMGRWLENLHNAHDYENALIYHKTKTAWIEAILADKEFDAFAFWAKQLLKHGNQVLFLGKNQSYVRNGIEYAIHGDVGPNGARGSRQAFVNLGNKLVIGHSHTPGITDGVFQVGTTSLKDLGYNRGFSSWCHTHCITYPNGKRTLVSIINGSWRMPRRKSRHT